MHSTTLALFCHYREELYVCMLVDTWQVFWDDSGALQLRDGTPVAGDRLPESDIMDVFTRRPISCPHCSNTNPPVNCNQTV